MTYSQSVLVKSILALIAGAVLSSQAGAQVLSNPNDPKSPQYMEPQRLTGMGDREFLSTLPLVKPRGDFYNFLVIGQDARSGGRKGVKTSRRAGGARDADALSSRGDIILLVSLDRVNKKGTVYSIYRGNTVPDYCYDSQKAPYSEPLIIADYYGVYGRKGFVPCVQRMFTERIISSGTGQSGMLSAKGLVNIHAIFEGTKLETITPVGNGAYEVLKNNKLFFLSAYGAKPVVALAELFINKNTIRAGLNGTDEIAAAEPPRGANPGGVGLQRQLMERKSYSGGGYQRGYNVARFISDLMSWTAPGILSDIDLMLKFEHVFDTNISYTIPLRAFNTEMKEFGGGEHPFTWLGYVNGKTQARVVQFGSTLDSYVAFDQSGGVRNAGGTAASVNTTIQLLPSPPSVR